MPLTKRFCAVAVSAAMVAAASLCGAEAAVADSLPPGVGHVMPVPVSTPVSGVHTLTPPAVLPPRVRAGRHGGLLPPLSENDWHVLRNGGVCGAAVRSGIPPLFVHECYEYAIGVADLPFHPGLAE